MKLLIALALIIALGFAWNGSTPRSAVSCDGNVPGVFWDG